MSSVSSTSSINSSDEETPDWTFRTATLASRASIPITDSNSITGMPIGKISDAAYKSLKFKRKPETMHLVSNDASGFTFRGPLTVSDESNTDTKAVKVAKREKKICRQFAVDMTFTGDRSPVPDPTYETHCKGGRLDNCHSAEKRFLSSKQSSFKKSTLSLQHLGYNGGKQCSGRPTYGRSNSHQLPIEKSQKSVQSASNRPKFSRSATLEWTFEGPSSQVPSSDWIDSFTRQHGLASSSAHQRRSSLVNDARSSLDNPRTAMNHRVLSKSPSAPTQDLNSRSIKHYGSTNSSFEHHPSDPIPPTMETRVLVHHVPSLEGFKKQEKSSSWSRKLGITGSQFLTTGWTSSSKRSPTYPLISPSPQSRQPSFASLEQESSRNSNSTSIEMFGADLDVPAIDFCGSTSHSQSTRAHSSETSWIMGNRLSLNTADANPVRRRIPVTKLHRSPSRSNRSMTDTTKSPLDTVVQVNSSAGTGWLSIARNQRAKIKKCRALGKLYTTVKVEDDDVSVLVTTD